MLDSHPTNGSLIRERPVHGCVLTATRLEHPSPTGVILQSNNKRHTEVVLTGHHLYGWTLSRVNPHPGDAWAENCNGHLRRIALWNLH